MSARGKKRSIGETIDDESKIEPAIKLTPPPQKRLKVEESPDTAPDENSEGQTNEAREPLRSTSAAAKSVLTLLPDIGSNVVATEEGTRHSHEWRMSFGISADKHERCSPWHDIPLGFVDADTDDLLFHFVAEIACGERAKFECATDEEWNPLRHDLCHKGELRYFKYGALPFNYGFIPQTWEDPAHRTEHSESELFGDNDPIDLVEISDAREYPIRSGEVVPVKVLGVLGLIDEGETDWKVIAVRADHALVDKVNSIEDARRVLGCDTDKIVDWFENYKVPHGKATNEFTHNKEIRDARAAVEVIEQCHRHWHALVRRREDKGGEKDGGDEKGKLALTSITRRHLTEQSVTCRVGEDGAIESIAYPRKSGWKAIKISSTEQES